MNQQVKRDYLMLELSFWRKRLAQGNLIEIPGAATQINQIEKLLAKLDGIPATVGQDSRMAMACEEGTIRE